MRRMLGAGRTVRRGANRDRGRNVVRGRTRMAACDDAGTSLVNAGARTGCTAAAPAGARRTDEVASRTPRRMDRIGLGLPGERSRHPSDGGRLTACRCPGWESNPH